MSAPVYEITTTFTADDATAVGLAREIDKLVAAHMHGTAAPNTVLMKTSTSNIPWMTWRES